MKDNTIYSDKFCDYKCNPLPKTHGELNLKYYKSVDCPKVSKCYNYKKNKCYYLHKCYYNNGLPCNVINCKYDHYLPSYYNNIIHLNQNKNNSVIDENIKEQNVNEKTNELKKQLVIKTINLKNNIDDIIIDLFVSVPELRDLIHKAFEKGMKP
jgi:hypothetical protein